MKRKLHIFLCLLMSVQLASANARSVLESEVFFQNLTTRDGLSQMSVVSIYQDHLGFMWFGTRNGVDRYDGMSFEHFATDEQSPGGFHGDLVRCFSEDSEGNLLIGTSTALNLFDAASHTFRPFYFHGDASASGQVNDVRALCVDPETGTIYAGGYSGLGTVNLSEGIIDPLPSIQASVLCLCLCERTLYIGTSRGLLALDLETGVVSSSSPFLNVGRGLNQSVDVIYQDASGYLWLGSLKKGIIKMDKENLKPIRWIDLRADEQSPNVEITAMTRASDGNILIGTTSGLKYLDETTLTISDLQPDRINYSVRALAVDSVGSLWVGTYTAGIFHSNQYGDNFKVVDLDNGKVPLGALGPMTMYGGKLWIATGGSGMLRLDPKTFDYEVYPFVVNSNSPYRNNNVKSVMLDDDVLYAGSYTGVLYRFDMKSRKISGSWRIPDPAAIYGIGQYGDKLILGTYSEHTLVSAAIPAGNFEPIALPGVDDSQIQKVSCLLSTGNDLYVGTKYDGFFHYDGTKVTHYSDKDSDTFSGSMMNSILQRSNGDVVVATSDKGLNVFRKGEAGVLNVSMRDGLADNNINTAVEDPYGQLWVVTRTAISVVDDGYRVIRTYRRGTTLPVYEFDGNSSFLAPDGTIYIGATTRLLSFRPHPIVRNENVPPVVITSLSVNDVRQNMTFDETPSLTLRHNQNNITIGYSVLNFFYPEECAFKCRLDGYDDDWVDMKSTRTVTYAGLKPGKYEFQVIGCNNDGVWNMDGASISVHVKHPLYHTVWAYLLYLIAISVLTWLAWKYSRTRMEYHQNKLLQEQESKLYQERIDLFTNFSHELRTPLTLIKAPVEEVIQSDDVSHVTVSSFKMINNNLNRILTLVDQIMTFRKQESGMLKVHVSEGDFVGFAREMKLAFGQVALHRSINLRMEEGRVPEHIWYDRGLFERVFMNLLSNAFKYVPDGGLVRIVIDSISRHELRTKVKGVSSGLYSDAANYLRVRIEDNGPGINPADMDKIFAAFYQSDTSHGGTGVGLAVASAIVTLHHGAIWADRSPEGGALFTVVIPEGRDHFSDDEIIDNYSSSESISRYYEIDVPAETTATSAIKAHPDYAVLVVEDNDELRDFIVSKLSPYYRVLKASNGKEGKIAALTDNPRLIISDIMMPVMDGLEMCRELKSNPKTSHIPIILLSARTLVLQMKEGLELGADDYITKPFNVETLLLKVSNIIGSRENLKNLFAKDLALENMGIEIKDSSDEKFLQRLGEIVSANITDPELDIDSLYSKLGMSRASLYRKLNEVTGMSPSRYIQQVRLHLAAKLLKESDSSISEIMEMTGFTNAAHFSTAFKKRYGVPPSKYKQSC